MAGAEVVSGHGFWGVGAEMAGAFGPGALPGQSVPKKAGIRGQDAESGRICHENGRNLGPAGDSRTVRPEKAVILGTGDGHNEKKSNFVKQTDDRTE
jgi:hypothetical protein